MIVVGLTGSVGTGKTELSKYIKKKKIPIFECDNEVKIIYKSKFIFERIKRIFPEAINNNNINRRIVATSAFKDNNKLKKLEGLIYEQLKNIQKKWIRKQIMLRKKIVVFDVPLLFEKDSADKYDTIVLLTCSSFIQKIRVLKRKDWDLERLNLTRNKQMKDSIKISLADEIIYTDRGKRNSFSKLLIILKKIDFFSRRPIPEILGKFS